MKALARAAIVAACVFAAFPSGAAPRVANTTTWTDVAGDAGGGPDITALTISDASSTVQFAFTVTNMSPNSAIYVFIDGDRNSATGQAGADYAVEMDVDPDGSHWYDVLRWDGSTWTSVPESSQMGMAVNGTTWTLRAGVKDLGGPTSFAFYVHAGLVDPNTGAITASDWLPDDGTYVYDLSPPTPTVPAPTPSAVVPWIGTPTITPAPRAGATVNVTFAVTNRTTGAPLTSGTMMCDPQVNGKLLAHQESFGYGVAKLHFKLPKTAKGKTLRVNLTIRVGSKTAHRVATFKIK